VIPEPSATQLRVKDGGRSRLCKEEEKWEEGKREMAYLVASLLISLFPLFLFPYYTSKEAGRAVTAG
jgi:hypothetical protein